MSKSEYSTEDFVLDTDFQKWVLDNNPESKSYWVNFLSQYPNKVKEIYQAREILIHLAREKKELSDAQVQSLFDRISEQANFSDNTQISRDSKVIELDSWSTIQKYNTERDRKLRRKGLIKSAAVFTLILGLSSLFLFLDWNESSTQEIQTVEWLTFEAPAGVKSSISLEDGSKVHLNSGSKISYPKNFPEGIRTIQLEGEAFFEVAKDSLRPFKVNSGHLITTALGTSFNIKAYPHQSVAVSLITGKVKVEDQINQENQALLNPGEGIQADQKKNFWRQARFNKDDILAWMNKTIIFSNTPIKDAIIQLENWYGVRFTISGEIPKDLIVSGKFKDETLQNILEGLSFSARLESYSIQGKNVQLNFKP